MDGCFSPLIATKSLRRNWMPRQALLFPYWLPRHPVFLIHLPLPNTVRLPLVTYASLCNTSMTCRTLWLSNGHQVLPTQALSRVPFPMDEKHFKHVPLLTYLIYFSPNREHMVGLIYIIKSPGIKLIRLSLVLNQRFKSLKCW